MSHDLHEQRIFSAYSLHIEELRTQKSIVTRIKSLNILLNGALNITYNYSIRRINFKNYRARNISISDSINLFTSELLEEFPFNGTEEQYQKNPNLARNDSFESYLFSIAKADFIVRTLLFQAGIINTYSINEKILTWNTLYKIVDTVTMGCKEINISINDLIYKKDLKNFTQSCNNPFILGINARHGKGDKNQIISTPLTDINRAIELILCLAKQFLNQYLEIKNYLMFESNGIQKCYIQKSKEESSKEEWEKLRFEISETLK